MLDGCSDWIDTWLLSSPRVGTFDVVVNVVVVIGSARRHVHMAAPGWHFGQGLGLFPLFLVERRSGPEWNSRSVPPRKQLRLQDDRPTPVLSARVLHEVAVRTF